MRKLGAVFQAGNMLLQQVAVQVLAVLLVVALMQIDHVVVDLSREINLPVQTVVPLMAVELETEGFHCFFWSSIYFRTVSADMYMTGFYVNPRGQNTLSSHG